MAFSIGQNFFNDLLKSSDKTTINSDNAINETYLKQKRLNDFWVNNDIPVLLKSKKFSGMKDFNGESEPLGGHINWSRDGARNAPGSCKNGCCSEYPFWGSTNNNIVKNKENKENKENFIETNLNNKEYLTETSNNNDTLQGTIPWIVIIILILLMLFFTFIVNVKGKNTYT